MPIWRTQQVISYFNGGAAPPDLTTFSIGINANSFTGKYTYGARSCEFVVTAASSLLDRPAYCLHDTTGPTQKFCTDHGGT